MTPIFHTTLLAVAFATSFVAAPKGASAQDFKKGYVFFKAGNYEAALKEWGPLADQGRCHGPIQSWSHAS